jgi:hypothetical protein
MGKLKSVIVITLVALCIGLVPAFSVMAESRSPIVKLEGTIDAITAPGDGDDSVALWVIGGQTVQVDDYTVVIAAHGEAVEGAKVVVIAGRGADDSLRALIVRVLRSAKRQRQVTIRGTVSEIGPDYAVVNGLRIQITEETLIEGSLAEGEFVVIRASVQGSEITALQIQVKTRVESRTVEFKGEIEAIDESTGIWTIAGRAVTVNENTQVRGEPQVGDTATVRAQVQEDESLLAVCISVARDIVPQPQEDTFTGEIQRIAPNNIGRWVIGGQQVIVGPQTVINGTPKLGAEAEVRGLRIANRALAASEITITEAPEELVFTGVVNKMPPGRPVGLWVIGTWRVVVVPDTEIIGKPSEGARVQFAVKQRGNNGALVAVWIKVLDDVEPTEEPTVPPTVEPTIPATVEPTIPATVEPTVPPTGEPTVPPTVPAGDEEEPTIAPEPDGTPEPGNNGNNGNKWQ